MSSDTAAASQWDLIDPEIMASIDTTESTTRLVIADISTDDAWLSTRIADAVPLSDWR